MNYTFAPVQSAIMGAFIAITDVLLRPGLQVGIQALLMYLVQATMLYVVFQMQKGSSPLCNIGPRSGGSIDFGSVFMKALLGTMILWLTDLVLRPQYVNNMWIQFLKFLIQGSIIWHVYNRDFMSSNSVPGEPAAERHSYY